MGEIHAEVHSDDRVLEAEFDATAYFEQASDDDLLALARCSWGGDYPADQVAIFMADHNEAVADVFKYLELTGHLKNHPGFECHVTQEDAVSWLHTHRPHLDTRVRSILEGDE